MSTVPNDKQYVFSPNTTSSSMSTVPHHKQYVYSPPPQAVCLCVYSPTPQAVYLQSHTTSPPVCPPPQAVCQHPHITNPLSHSPHQVSVPLWIINSSMSGYRKLCESENDTLDVSTVMWNETAQSVYRLFTGWTFRGSKSCGERFSAPIQTAPGAHPASYTMGTGSFPGV